MAVNLEIDVYCTHMRTVFLSFFEDSVQENQQSLGTNLQEMITWEGAFWEFRKEPELPVNEKVEHNIPPARNK